jgi:hypothetical protein
LDGQSNWLSDEKRGEELGNGLTKMGLWVAGIGFFVYWMAAWRTRSFQTKAISIGHSMEWANQKIRPSWAWYLLSAYLLFATLVTAGMIAIQRSYSFAAAVFFLGLSAGFVVGGIVMWRRGKRKRWILANNLSAIPPASSPPPIPASVGGPPAQ